MASLETARRTGEDDVDNGEGSGERWFGDIDA